MNTVAHKRSSVSKVCGTYVQLVFSRSSASQMFETRIFLILKLNYSTTQLRDDPQFERLLEQLKIIEY